MACRGSTPDFHSIPHRPSGPKRRGGGEKEILLGGKDGEDDKGKRKKPLFSNAVRFTILGPLQLSAQKTGINIFVLSLGLA